jgi:hypothetical protein
MSNEPRGRCVEENVKGAPPQDDQTLPWKMPVQERNMKQKVKLGGEGEIATLTSRILSNWRNQVESMR